MALEDTVMWQPLTLPITERQEEYAQDFRAKRDAEFGYNRYPVHGNEVRWYGDLAELRLWNWLKGEGIPHQWLNQPAPGLPDFLIWGRTIEVKQEKVHQTPRITHAVSLSGPDRPIEAEYVLFASYEYKRRVMWFHGLATQADVLRRGTRYEPGEWIHPNWQVQGQAVVRVRGLDWLMPVRALAKVGVAA